MAGGLQLWLLGGFRAAAGGRPVADQLWPRSRAKAVVKLLALSPDHRLHREQLMELLWPGLASAAAGANLRKAVHFARRALGPEHLQLRERVLGIEAIDLWIDVDAFTAAAASGLVDEAIDLYAGELLPEDLFEAWSAEPRRVLARCFTGVLSERARVLSAGGDVRGAAEALERVVDLDPFNEDAVRHLMNAYALAGQRHLALARFAQLEARLSDELGVRPGLQIRRVRQEVADDRLAARAEENTPAAVPANARVSRSPESSSRTSQERKLVTVVFLDATFSAMAADPERMLGELDRWAPMATEIVESWAGTAESLVGASMVAVFGVPRVLEDDAARALCAGVELLEASRWPVRIGIATGEVIVLPEYGRTLRRISGEVLEVAAGLKEAAEPGTIMVAERTCRATSTGTFRFGEPTRLTRVGLPDVWGRHLTGPVGRRDIDGPRVQGPMVGRDPELGRIQRLFDEVAGDRRPRLLTITAPAGAGKSRLVNEAVARMVTRRPGTLVLRGRCVSAGRRVTYWALGEILREACGISFADPVSEAEAKLWNGLRAILRRGSRTGRLDATVLALAATAGIRVAGSPIDRLDPKTVNDEVRRAWPSFATACASEGPALFVIEDLHWAGDQMLEMLELMVAQATGPLLVIATARAELATARPGFGSGLDCHDSITLRPLSAAQSRTLLDRLELTRALPTAARQEVLARAEGNPFFLEELVLHLTDHAGGALPDTVHALLAARLDALPHEQKHVLQQASVVGRVFWEEPVVRGVGGAPVRPELARLTRGGFVVRRPSSLPGQSEFGFRHALTQEVAYASIPKGPRLRAHAQVGTWLEEVIGDRGEEMAELLAYHFGVAAGRDAELAWPEPADRKRMRVRAFGHLLRAGDAARRRFALTTAIDLHEQAMGLAAGLSERLLAGEALGGDHEAAFHGDEASEWYQRALAIARGDPTAAGRRDLSRLCRKLAWLMSAVPGAFPSSPDPAMVERLVTEGLAASADEVERAWLLLVRGVSARLWRGSEPFGQGREHDPVPIDQRIADVEHAADTGRICSLPDLVAAAEHSLGVLYGVAGRYGEVLALTRAELEHVEHAGSALEQADILRRAAVHTIAIEAGFEKGLALGRRCHALSVGTGPHQVMHATWPVLVALYYLGRWRELRSVLDEHRAAYEQEPAGECLFARDGAVIGAIVLAQVGDSEGARALASVVGDPLQYPDQASPFQSSYAVVSGQPLAARTISAGKALAGGLYGPQHAMCLLEALVASRDWDAVATFLPHARSCVPGNALLGPSCDRAEGIVQAQAGRGPVAATALRRAVAGFDDFRVPFEAARTRELLAEVAAPAAAKGHLRAALRAYERLGAKPRCDAVSGRL